VTPGVARRLAWALWLLVVVGLAAIFWFDQLLRRVGRPDLVSLGADAVPYLLGMMSAATVGAVLAGRRPRHPVGWLLLALGLSVIALGLCDAYASYGLLARPGSLPAARWAAVYQDASWILLTTLIGFILLLTPTGSLPTTRWRWWARIAVVAPVVATTLRPGTLDEPFEAVDNPLAVSAGPLVAIATVADVVTLVAVVVAAASLVARFRRARGVERLQLRWVAFAGVLAGVAVGVILVSWALGGGEVLWGWAGGLYVAALPLMTGASVLRYRLYDLDRIISRTLSYGLLTVLLGVGYAGAVLLLGRLLGRDSSLAVAGATLMVAGVFQPARRRVQQAVDRRFNRRRFDAGVTIQAFSARLRQQIELDSLTAELLAVVEATMQPTRVSLWLRPPQRPAGTPPGPTPSPL